MRRLVAASLLVAATAFADERALHDAQARGSLDELEALGAARPITPWTDDAWRSAAQLAERTGDYVRATHDLEQAIATTDDEQLARRSRADLERLSAISSWTQVAAEHDRLVQLLERDGDPTPALHSLERLIRENPRYPRRVAAMLTLARGLEREGDRAASLRWLREAAALDSSTRAKAELARTQIRGGLFDDAAATIASLADRGLASQLRESLDRAHARRTMRWLTISLLVTIVIGVAWSLRRRWRQLARPPTEVLFLVPFATVLIVGAQMSNPLVAAAIRLIAIAGVIVAWVSGASLTGRRVTLRTALVHALVATMTMACVVFLALERDRALDLVIETWRSGPTMR